MDLAEDNGVGSGSNESGDSATSGSTTLLEVPLMVFLGTVEWLGLGDFRGDRSGQSAREVNPVDGTQGSIQLRIVVVEDH